MRSVLARWFLLRIAGRQNPIRKRDLIMLQGHGNTTTIYVKEPDHPDGYKTYNTGKNLKKYEHLLDVNFVRVSQTHIVNLRFVSHLEGFSKLVFKLPKDVVVTIGKAYRKGFLGGFGKL